MDSDDSAEWLEPCAILIVKTFAALAKQGHSAGSNAPEGSKVLRNACEEIRRLVNSCVRHDKVWPPLSLHHFTVCSNLAESAPFRSLPCLQ